ncbi:Hypothetical predicted protein [Pelobates cultripes]|uniref:Uncharacterized protein n=1 Tax=Pelobates cultripes TaxID=61616 RepID=A0AAD1WBK2_PELCU|nr:Hypothetical predicted protein [Pelobates cultripes]
MFPTNPETVPDSQCLTVPYTHSSRVKLEKAQTPQASSRPERQKQRDISRQQETGYPSGGNRSILTAPGNRQVIVWMHISPPSHQPDSEGPSPRGQNYPTHSLPA